MAETYEVLSQRVAQEIDPATQDLRDVLEITAKAAPAGTVFSVRLPLEEADAGKADAALAAKAETLNSIAKL